MNCLRWFRLMVLMIYCVMEIVHWLMLLPQEMEILVIKSITHLSSNNQFNLPSGTHEFGLLMKMDV